MEMVRSNYPSLLLGFVVRINGNLYIRLKISPYVCRSAHFLASKLTLFHQHVSRICLRCSTCFFVHSVIVEVYFSTKLMKSWIFNFVMHWNLIGVSWPKGYPLKFLWPYSSMKVVLESLPWPWPSSNIQWSNTFHVPLSRQWFLPCWVMDNGLFSLLFSNIHE